MQSRQVSKKYMAAIEEEEDYFPFVKKSTEPNQSDCIFGRKEDLRRSFNVFKNRRQSKEKQKLREREKLDVAEFANPFIKMKVETARYNKSSNKLLLACIDLGFQHHNPESAPTTTKQSRKGSINIRDKLKNNSQHRFNKKNSTDEKEHTKRLVQISKEYLGIQMSQTEILLEKLKTKSSKSKQTPIHHTPSNYRKRILGGSKHFNCHQFGEEVSSLWPFNPYKTMKDRIAKSYEMIHSYQFKETNPLAFKI